MPYFSTNNRLFSICLTFSTNKLFCICPTFSTNNNLFCVCPTLSTNNKLFCICPTCSTNNKTRILIKQILNIYQYVTIPVMTKHVLKCYSLFIFTFDSKTSSILNRYNSFIGFLHTTMSRINSQQCLL